jgi:YD repeat-containing protein
MEAAALPPSNAATGTNVLAEVPAFYWAYGCSATSAAMMAGYYDRNGYPNMYTGPTNGGMCPLDNATWGTSVEGYGECPLSATHLGVDGRSTRGHVNDYYSGFGSTIDPFVSNEWEPHEHGDCTADFMKTNIYTDYQNTDGATSFYINNSTGAPYSGPGFYGDDGGHGLMLFLQSRGYTVTEYFNQYIAEYGMTYGFSFADFQQEIDAGRPVLIHLVGHTVLGFGYDTEGSVVYIKDTWDHATHTMTWGTSYGGMSHAAVTVIHLADNSSVFSDGFESHDMTRWSAFAP